MWCHSGALLRNVHIGAPADIWNHAGQNWDIPPFHPRRLPDEAYRPFIELLQSNMRHCGALRIDHPSPRVYASDSAGSTDDWSLLRKLPEWKDKLIDGTDSMTKAQLEAVANREHV